MQNPKYSSNTDDSGLPREEKLFHLLEELYGGIPEAEETLSAIRRGEVDGFLVSTDEGEKIYTLKTAEHPYRVLIEQMWEGAAILSSDGMILYSNESFARLLAMPLERVIGESIYTFIAPAGAANFRRMLEAKRSSGSAGENTLQAHRNKEVPVHLSLKLLPMDGTQVFSLVATDLTERRRVEETLQRAYDQLGEHQAELITQNEELREAHAALSFSEERYRDLYEFAPLGYFTLDARGEILEANLTGASLLGSERSRLIGARLQFFLEPRSLPAFNDFLARAMRSETNETCDVLLMRDEGEPAWALLEGKSVGDRDPPRIRVAVTDISRQVGEAERALRESEERFRLLTENASDIVVILDTGGHILYASPSVRQVGGYALEALIGRSVVELIHPEDLPLATESLSRVAAYPKERVTLEIRLRHNSGEWLYFEIIGVNLLDEPAVRGLVVNARDITWRKQAEEALQAALRQESLYNRINQVFLTVPGEGMYADVLAIAREEVQSPYGIFGYIDEKGAFVTPSFTSDIWDECRLLEKRTRWPPETWGGSIWGRSIREKRPLIKNAPSGHLPITRSMVVPVLWEGSVIGTFELANKPTDYTREDLAVIERIAGQVAPVLHARLERDRKEKARAEAIKALRESEERYRTLFNSMDEGFCIIEMIFDRHERPIDYRFLEINPAFERQTGLPDAKGKRMREMVPAHEEFWFETYGSIARTGEPRRFTHEAIPLMGGWYEVYAFPFGEKGSNQVAILFDDITDRKKAEEEREALMDRIEQAHREANLYLDIITHDIRNANNVSTMYADLMVELTEGELKAYAEKLHASIRRSTEILRNVATIRRVHEESVSLAPVSLDAVIREEAANFPAARIRYDDPQVEVCADSLLPIVFANLFGNAVKYGGPGVEVAVRMDELDGRLLVSVEDTGPGIPDEVKGTLFQRFERGLGYGRGEGLGLYIVRTLVERYGGRIRIEDRVPGHPEQGAAFRFSLKRA